MIIIELGIAVGRSICIDREDIVTWGTFDDGSRALTDLIHDCLACWINP